MIVVSRIPMFNSVCLVPLLVLLLTLTPNLCRAQISQCDASRRANGTASLEQICYIAATVRREEDCSARITEEYLLPFASGRTISKMFRFINGQQEVKDMSLSRNEKLVDVPSSLKVDENNKAQIQFASNKTKSPVLYKLQYTLTTAVTKFSRVCPETPLQVEEPEEESRSNVIRWALGSMEEVGREELPILELSISFVTDDKDATLIVSGHDFALDGDNPQNQTVFLDTLSSTFDTDLSTIVLAEERGVAQCSQELRCFLKDETAWEKFGKWVSSTIAVLAFLIFVGLVIYCWCRPNRYVVHHVHS